MKTSLKLLGIIMVMFIFTACSQNKLTTAPAVPATEPPAQTPPAKDLGSTPQPINVPVQVEQKTISIHDFTFDPTPLIVSPGSTVVWTNDDPMPHTVTSDTGVFGSGTLSTGQTYSFTFTTAGTFDYHCNIHKTMLGKIIVQ